MNADTFAALTEERAILGSILCDNAAFYEAAASLHVGDFSLSSHRTIYAAICRLIESGSDANSLTVRTALIESGELEGVGGIGYVLDLDEGIPRGFGIAPYIRTMKGRAARRELANLGQHLTQSAMDAGIGTEDLLSGVESRLLEIRAGRDSAGFAAPEDAIAALLSQMEVERTRPSELLGLPSGIPALDRMTRGYQPGELTVCGAASGVGKTSLMTQAAIANAGQGVPTLLFSLEMSEQQLLRRVLCAVSGVPFQKVRDARWASPEDLDRIKGAALRVAEWPLRIVDDSGLSIEKLTATARLAIRRHGVRLVAVDYIQIVNAPGKDERLRVSAISRGLTRLAKSEQVPVLALSQLSRPDRSAAKRRPAMSDLRESSQIENDSHCIVLLHRERDEEERLLPEGQLIIAKQRSGTTGSIPVTYSGQTLTFSASEPTREPIQFAARR